MFSINYQGKPLTPEKAAELTNEYLLKTGLAGAKRLNAILRKPIVLPPDVVAKKNQYLGKLLIKSAEVRIKPCFRSCEVDMKYECYLILAEIQNGTKSIVERAYNESSAKVFAECYEAKLRRKCIIEKIEIEKGSDIEEILQLMR